MEEQTFTIEQLIAFVLSDDYWCSFDDALEFVKLFALSHDIILDVEGIRRQWQEARGLDST